jgi:hypothetical protein
LYHRGSGDATCDYLLSNPDNHAAFMRYEPRLNTEQHTQTMHCLQMNYVCSEWTVFFIISALPLSLTLPVYLAVITTFALLVSLTYSKVLRKSVSHVNKSPKKKQEWSLSQEQIAWVHRFYHRDYQVSY